MTLEVENVDAGYGPIQALQERVPDGGGGRDRRPHRGQRRRKTTMLMVISGLVPTRRGFVRWRDEALNELRPQQVVARRVAHVPEGRHVFLSLSVDEICRWAPTGAGTRPRSSATGKRSSLCSRASRSG